MYFYPPLPQSILNGHTSILHHLSKSYIILSFLTSIYLVYILLSCSTLPIYLKCAYFSPLLSKSYIFLSFPTSILHNFPIYMKCIYLYPPFLSKSYILLSSIRIYLSIYLHLSPIYKCIYFYPSPSTVFELHKLLSSTRFYFS